MECTWFFGVDLRTSAIIISVLGIVHPAFWALAVRRFRSEWFITLYVLTGGWCLVSILLLAGVLADVIMLYWIWMWFSIVFVPVMIIGMILMIVGFCVLRMRTTAICPAFGLVYYILTIYCICVVNTQRRDLLHERGAAAGRAGPARAATAAAAAQRGGTRALRGASLELPPAPPTQTTPPAAAAAALLTPTIKPPRRGSCVLPARQPANGVYLAAQANNKVAQPGRGYRRLHLWVYCNKYYKPRHLQYSFCYSGGWNLPLPDCVKDESYYEVYYDNYNPEATTMKSNRSECAVPPPPAHGYFTRDAKLTKRYMQLAVRCNALHYLVGWQRVTCYDGVWDRPMPSCDESVCSLVKSNDKMVRTCLAGTLYAGTYRCEEGLVPHGTVVEPRCRRDHYVWGTFDYMYCINGIWHPKLLANNITCEYAADIYRHYEIEATRKTTTMMAYDGEGDEESDDPKATAANTTATAANTTATAVNITHSGNKTHPGGRRSGHGVVTRTHSTNTTHRLSSSSTKLDTPGLWKTQSEADHFRSSNPATIGIWKSRRETNNFEGTDTIKRNITDIWKAQIETVLAPRANSIETSIWKPPTGEAFIDNSIDPDRKTAAGASSDTKLANIGEWPSLRDRQWFSVDSIESQIESDESLVDNLIKINIRNPRNKVEGPSTTNAIQAGTWKPAEAGGESSGGPSGKTDLWKPYGGHDESRTVSNKMSRRKSRKYADKWLSVHSNTRRNNKTRRASKYRSNITKKEKITIKLSGRRDISKK